MLWRVKSRPERLLPAKFIQPCIAVAAEKVPTGPGWIHEIKHDGYRMQVRKDGERVRLYTRRGYDWTARYPRAAAAVAALKVRSVVLDCELVCVDTRGIADFARLHSRGYDDEAILYAFDVMEIAGEDVKALPLGERKAILARALRQNAHGLHLVDHDAGDGAALFRAACKMGLEGIVSKKITSRYKPGPKPFPAWVKVKNKSAPGYLRFRDGLDG